MHFMFPAISRSMLMRTELLVFGKTWRPMRFCFQIQSLLCVDRFFGNEIREVDDAAATLRLATIPPILDACCDVLFFPILGD